MKHMIGLKDTKRSVTCVYDNFWWLVCVLSLRKESNDMKASILHPPGSCASYIYTAAPYILWLPQSPIQAKVTPNTATGYIHMHFINPTFVH
jgi:hypothetical protein